jgi:hypothetical protein
VVNTEELKELVADCPTLYHMAALGSWPSIRERGLLSTSALLDAYQVTGEERLSIEEERRGKSIVLKHEKLPPAVVRDQLPMMDGGLLRCLPKHILQPIGTNYLIRRHFFGRLIRLLNAGTYRNEAHDVLEVCTQGLLDNYFDKIWFCPMNSGSTKPMPHPRDEKTFRRNRCINFRANRRLRGRRAGQAGQVEQPGRAARSRVATAGRVEQDACGEKEKRRRSVYAGEP